jgi:hypothetical protein
MLAKLVKAMSSHRNPHPRGFPPRNIIARGDRLLDSLSGRRPSFIPSTGNISRLCIIRKQELLHPVLTCTDAIGSTTESMGAYQNRPRPRISTQVEHESLASWPVHRNAPKRTVPTGQGASSPSSQPTATPKPRLWPIFLSEPHLGAVRANS